VGQSAILVIQSLVVQILVIQSLVVQYLCSCSVTLGLRSLVVQSHRPSVINRSVTLVLQSQ